ncbi:MAG: hypothetical protein CSA62_11470 [Planctomycetota bacterium]|nr:MAG: hypothetical protein CSA62_11470 [Planctomycetota bacterium]
MLLLAALPLVPALGLGFYGDDFGRIGGAHRGAGEPWPYLATTFTAQRDAASGVAWFRPLYELSYLLDDQVFGLRPWASRLLEYLAHAGFSLLLARLALRLGASAVQSFFAALIFAWGAQHSEAVVWVAARDSLWAVGFGLLTLLAFVEDAPRGRGLRPVLGCLAYVAASLSKELALPLPFLVFACGFLRAENSGQGLAGRLRSAWRSSWPLLLVLLCLLGWRFYVFGGLGGARYPLHAPPELWSGHYWWTRLQMLGAVLVPVRHDSFSLWVWGAMALLPGLLLLRALLRFRQRGTLLLLLLWVLLGLAPLHWSQVDPGNFGSGRHLYQLSAPLALILALGLGPKPSRWLLALLAGHCLALAGLQAHTAWQHREAFRLASTLYSQMQQVVDRADRAGLARLRLEGLPFERFGVPIGSVLGAVLLPPWRPAAPRMPVELYNEVEDLYRLGAVIRDQGQPGLRRESYLWAEDQGRFIAVPKAGLHVLRVDLEPGRECLDAPFRLPVKSGKGVRVLRYLLGEDGQPGRVLGEEESQRTLLVDGELRPGAELRIRVVGPPRSQVFVLGPGGAAFLPVRGLGTLLLHPPGPPLGQGFIGSDAPFELRWRLPRDPRIVGMELRLQAALNPPRGAGYLSACWCRVIQGQ